MTNFGCFFLCGLPGGLNYVALVLVRQGYMTPIQQKGFDAAINTWLRGPSMAIYAFLIWQTWLYGNYDLAPFLQVLPRPTVPSQPPSALCFLFFLDHPTSLNRAHVRAAQVDWSRLALTLAPSPLGSAGFLAFVAVLHFWNGQYYCSMAVGNYHATLAKQEAAAAPSTGSKRSE